MFHQYSNHIQSENRKTKNRKNQRYSGLNNPDNGKSTSSYIAFLSNGPVSFKVGLQGLTAQSTMEAELVAAALTMKEAVFCSNMMKELGFGTRFDNVPVYIDNTSPRRRQPDL